jgi:hypothetical protein
MQKKKKEKKRKKSPQNTKFFWQHHWVLTHAGLCRPSYHLSYSPAFFCEGFFSFSF